MLSITHTTKGKLPRLPFARMKNTVLGKEYRLSLAFIGSVRSRTLNRTYRKKDKSTNILAFPLSKDEGEILIDLTQSKKDMKKFGRPYENFIAFLFIHGLIHLDGWEHGSKMEDKEKAVRKIFGI